MSKATVYLILIAFTAINASCSKKTLNSNKLQDRNGLYYEVNSDKPFSGYAADSVLGIRTTYAEISNGKFDGVYITYYRNTQIEEKGKMSDNMKDGVWEFYYENGQLKEKGNYSKSIKDGQWEFYYKNGQLKEKGKYNIGDMNGIWKYYSTYGDLIEQVEYLNGTRNGEYIYFKNQDTLRYIEYIDGKISNKLKIKPDYEVGSEEIYSIPKGSSSKLGINSKFEYLGFNSVENDIDVNIFDGKEKVGFFSLKRGYYNGSYKEPHSNGKIKSEGQFLTGRKTGQWRYYFNDGSIKEIQNFNDENNLSSTILFDVNGDTTSIESIKDGKLNGLFLNSNLGCRDKRGNYLDGYRDGWWIIYRSASFGSKDCNQVVSNNKYNNGYLEQVIQFHSNGVKRMERSYRGGMIYEINYNYSGVETSRRSYKQNFNLRYN